MVDFINDYRGSDNRYQVRKHYKPNKKQERYWIKRAKISRDRYSALSYRKDVFMFYDKSADDTDEIEPDFYDTENDFVFILYDLVDNNDMYQLEALCLYSPPGSLGQLINTFGWPIEYLYPSESPFMIVANSEHNRLAPAFLDQSLNIDVNLKSINKNTCSDNIYQRDDLYCQADYGCKFVIDINCKCKECNYGREKPVLWCACFNGRFNVVRTLIEIGKADVNLTNHENCTPLRAAISKNHIDIVKYLIEETNAIIDESRDLLIAIKIESYHIVNYLLNKGCDPNARLIDQDSINLQADYTYFPLHYAINCCSKDLPIIKTILEHGGDPTIKNDQGQTALHIAIQNKNEEIVKEILHYGFKHDQRDNNDQTPLMFAIINNETNLINLLYEFLPRQQYIDELMLLACFYTLKDDFDFINVNREGFIYFEQALKLQQPNSNAIPCDVYLFRRECQTIDELITIQNNSELMYIQALLVYERLLLQRDEIHLLIPKLIDLSYAYCDIGEYNRSLLIITHVYPMTLLSIQNLFHCWDKTCLSIFMNLLNLLIIEDDVTYMEKILQVFEWTFNHSYDVEKAATLCLYATYLLETHQMNNDDDKRRLIRLVKEAIRNSYYGYYSNNLFYNVVLKCVNSLETLFDRISSKKAVQLLIQCGADANEAEPGSGLRPIHLIAYALDIERARSIVEILIEAGAHTDCRDTSGFLPEGYARNIEIRELLRSKQSISLKCQCTHLIISSGIKYDLYLSKNLKNFILMHQGK